MVDALAAMPKHFNWTPTVRFYLNMALLQRKNQQWDAAEASYRKAVSWIEVYNALVALGKFLSYCARFPKQSSNSGKRYKPHQQPGPRFARSTLFGGEQVSVKRRNSQAGEERFPDNSDGYRMLGDFYFANNAIDQRSRVHLSLSGTSQDIAVKKTLRSTADLKNRLDEARK